MVVFFSFSIHMLLEGVFSNFILQINPRRLEHCHETLEKPRRISSNSSKSADFSLSFEFFSADRQCISKNFTDVQLNDSYSLLSYAE
jgi:hypothetical protein